MTVHMNPQRSALGVYYRSPVGGVRGVAPNGFFFRFKVTLPTLVVKNAVFIVKVQAQVRSGGGPWLDQTSYVPVSTVSLVWTGTGDTFYPTASLTNSGWVLGAKSFMARVAHTGASIDHTITLDATDDTDLRTGNDATRMRFTPDYFSGAAHVQIFPVVGGNGWYWGGKTSTSYAAADAGFASVGLGATNSPADRRKIFGPQYRVANFAFDFKFGDEYPGGAIPMTSMGHLDAVIVFFQISGPAFARNPGVTYKISIEAATVNWPTSFYATGGDLVAAPAALFISYDEAVNLGYKVFAGTEGEYWELAVQLPISYFSLSNNSYSVGVVGFGGGTATFDGAPVACPNGTDSLGFPTAEQNYAQARINALGWDP